MTNACSFPALSFYQPESLFTPQMKTEPKIPHILYFTHKDNLLEVKKPELHYKNVMKTINLYKAAWNDTDGSKTTVKFLVDNDCVNLIREAEPRLVPHFESEKQGMFKADICRVAALWLTGGYYFDVDMETIKPMIYDNIPECSFGTAYTPDKFDGFFQSFLVAAPRHPVIKKVMSVLLDNYENSKDKMLLGPKTMAAAYDELHFDREEPFDVCLLEEGYLTTRHMERVFPLVPRPMGNRPMCNLGVYSRVHRDVFFYSRFVGSSWKCESNQTKT